MQGCAGDINPWRRGTAAVAEMSDGIAKKTELVARFSTQLALGPLHIARAAIALPLTPAGKQRLGADSVDAEIQIIVCGPLALVALPGEPMTELGTTIRAASPFPQTIVLGYSNGNGAHYVGLPGRRPAGAMKSGWREQAPMPVRNS